MLTPLNGGLFQSKYFRFDLDAENYWQYLMFVNLSYERVVFENCSPNKQYHRKEWQWISCNAGKIVILPHRYYRSKTILKEPEYDVICDQTVIGEYRKKHSKHIEFDKINYPAELPNEMKRLNVDVDEEL